VIVKAGRIVVIVGRPNVGKSAIFNRLAARRVAIVHEESGVTRDRLMREVSWGDERFELVDTGGVCVIDGAATANEIESGIHRQVEAALEDAAVAILVTDVREGLVPLDSEVARILHAGGRTTVVAANKADNPSQDDDAAVFSEFGLPVFAVSALHNRGFGSLMGAVVGGLPAVENVTLAKPLRVAVVGRPNVGKSSYVNRLLRSERVIVSEIPGTTRDSIDVPFSVGKGNQARHYVLTDTAGLRRKGKVKDSVEKFSHLRAERTIAGADVVVLMLDALQGPTAQDKKIAASILHHNKGCLVVVNKWDLAAESTQRRYGPALVEAMPFMKHCPVLFISAETGYNIRRSVDAVDYVASQVQAELPTGILNRTILDATARVQPPAVKGKQLKIFYATQVGREPVRVRIFVNDPKRVKASYREYIVRTLRSKFGLEGAPVILHFRSRRERRGQESRAAKH